MISVGSGDGRKRLELGLEMEETELEEGEAGGYQDGDGESTIDPDITLSYIGEKIEKYLGHLQKDFEGGVSAENLGAKFGGYGSFLPTYQRSPSWSQTKSPAEGHNYDSPRSPRKLNLEDQRQKPFASSRASPFAISHDASGKAVSVGNSLKGKGNIPSNHVEEPILKSKAIKKSVYPSDQRTLKVRIKVGSENFLTQKNAELYNGLGLVVSPSSSLDDSPATSVEICGKRLQVPDESPTSILEIMTSYPGDLLLSPLPEDLVRLTERRKLGVKCENKHVDKMVVGSSGILENGFHSGKSNQKVIDLKKLKLYGKDDGFAMESASQKNNGDKEKSASFLKEKEIDINTLGCEELVTNALKLPFLLSSERTHADPAKDVPTAAIVKDGVKQETVPAQDDGRFEKLGGRMGSSGTVSESKKANIINDTVAFPQEEALGAEKSHDFDHLQSNASEGRKVLSASGPTRSSKQHTKGGPVSEEGLKPALEKSSTGSKRKPKVAQTDGIQGVCTEKDEAMVKSSLPQKGGKNYFTDGVVSKNDSHHLQKDHQKPGDRYKDIFGDGEFEDDDNESISGETESAGQLKNPHIFEKNIPSEELNLSKGKCDGKKSEKPPHAGTHPRVESLLAAPLGNRPSIEAPAGVVPLVEECWVSCDKCQKWRLLPLGTKPESLPRKWVCRMLNWLPGMNRCSVPEDETTNALRALYNPAPSVPNAAVTSAGAVPVEAKSPNHENQNTAVQNAAINGKKANSADLDGPTHSSNLRKKIFSTSEKISNWNSQNHSPSPNACRDQQMQQSSAVLKYKDTEEDKMSLINSSGKDANLKIKNKREADVEGSRAYKRIKSEELHVDDEYRNSGNGGTSSKAGCGSTGLSNNNTLSSDSHKYISDKDMSGEAKKSTVSFSNAGKHVPGTSDDDLLHSGKYDEESIRKRKAKEPHSSPVHTEPISSTTQRLPDSGDLVDELSQRKEKKARVSKSGAKDPSRSKTSVGTDKKIKEMKDQHNGPYLGNGQATNCLKSDMGTEQPLVAANSSSSKVTGSQKFKNSGQEIKGSPVESVCSSPLKFPNAVKATSTGKNLNDKDDLHDSGLTNVDSPRRISGDENEGRNERMGMGRKDGIVSLHDHSNHLFQSDKYGSIKQSSDKYKAEEKPYAEHSQNSGFNVKKSGKELSSHSKGTAGSDMDKVNIKVFDLHEGKLNGRKSKSDEKSGNPSKGEKCVSQKDTAEGPSRESSRGGQGQKKFGHDRQEAEHSRDRKHSVQNEHDNEKLPAKSNQGEAYVNGKSNTLPPLARCHTEPVDGSDDGDTLKAQNQRKRSEIPSSRPKRLPTPNSLKRRDGEAPSPLRKDSFSHAANNALREAKDLKHMADRLKNNSGSTESIALYFQAALKFLHGASLLESGSSEATKHNELMRSMHIYSSTAKLCEFCAHEYEKSKDMAAAALAYKCVEVAYMRVVYSSHSSASRDRSELSAVLQIAPSGESPSSSASDLDNLNHQATTDKAALAKAVGSPHVSGSHVITSSNRSSFMRMLNFAQDVNSAMEASRKSRIAFTAATSKLGETSRNEAILSLEKALDFNYQDVESFLRLVRVAMEAC